MDDTDLLNMAAFKLREAAKRIMELAAKAESSAARGRLALIARRLLEQARSLSLSEGAAEG
jgi:hypothetical protein